MQNEQANNSQRTGRRVVWAVVAVSLTLILAGVVGVVKLISGCKAPQMKRQVQQITLIKPPPPPKIKEQPPELKPEPEQQKEEIKDLVDVERPQEVDRPEESAPPPSGELGVDGDATGSGDAFGLQARKGGAALVGGGGGQGGDLYGWYTNRYGSELQKLVNDITTQMGGIKGTDLKTVVRVDIDDSGAIRGTIIASSGNPRMDEAVLQALSRFTLREPPPPGMPRAMKLGVMSQG
jgi:protein TonB